MNHEEYMKVLDRAIAAVGKGEAAEVEVHAERMDAGDPLEVRVTINRDPTPPYPTTITRSVDG